MPRRDRLKRSRQVDLQKSAVKCKKLNSFFVGQPSASKQDQPEQPHHDNGPVATTSTAASSSCETSSRMTKVSTVESWGFQWLNYEHKNGFATKVWCDLCRNHHEKGRNIESVIHPGQTQLCDLDAYIVGTSNVKKDTANCHNSSKTHIAALRASNPTKKSPMVQSLQTLNERTKDKLQKLFDLAYTVAYCEQPFTIYETLVAVERKHGVELGVTYANRKACRSFIGHIAGSMKDELENSFQGEPFYCSLLFDGSTDKSTSEKEVVSIKLLENGTPKIKLLGIAEPKKCDASGVHEAITNTCAKHHLDLASSLVSAAADGAAVNFGGKNGVLVKFQESAAPWMVKMHCVAHRLELSLKDAFKDTYFTQIDDLMMNLYYLYRRSAKRWRELKLVAEVLKQHVVKPSRSQGTRWIDHRRKALKCLATNYQCIAMQFEEQATGERRDIPAADAAKMKGYLKLLKSCKFVLYMALYQDLVDDMAELSLDFQKDDVPLSTVRSNVVFAQAALRRKRTTPGHHLGPVLAAFSAAKHVEEGKSPSMMHNGVEITIHHSITIDTFERQTADIVNKIITCIGTRFENFTSDPVLNAAEILDPSNFPADPDTLIDFGVEEIQILCNHFQVLLITKGCDMSKVEREWMKVKEDITRHHKKDGFFPLWQKMLNEKEGKYSNFLHLVRIILVLPVSTSQVERQFSFIKRFQGDWRLSLQTGTIEDLLRISTGGPEPAEFNSVPAVERWWKSGIQTKRPSIKPYGPRARATIHTEPDVSLSDHDYEESSDEEDIQLIISSTGSHAQDSSTSASENED